MKILLTGGAGYIGSHVAVELLRNNNEVIIVDNLINSSVEVIKKIQKITNKNVVFYETDLLNKNDLDKVFKENKVDAVIHLAGLKAVGESVKIPLLYYQNNLICTLNLLEIMQNNNCLNLIFSSSATVYGVPKSLPLTEESPLSTTNPYGYTKLVIENILKDIYNADNKFNITLLRYFNPVGADDSGLIGENPKGIPNNLFPFIMQVANGKLKELGIFGNDYDTPDGTAIRDYIHIVDLARGHVKALEKISGLSIYNLGTGNGYSVLECVNAFSKVVGKSIPYSFKPRREGDVPVVYACSIKAFKELGWKAEKTLDDMCESSWNFAKMLS